jgi:tol-pal system protein YbgF
MTYRIFVLALISVCAAGPAMAQSREDRQLMADVRMLQQQAQQLELTLNTLTATLTATLQALSQKVDAQSQKVDAQLEANRKTFADLKLLSDNISGDVRVVREKIDETNVRLGSVGQEVQAIQMALQTLSVGAPQSPATGTDPLAAGMPGPEPGVPVAPPAPPSTAPPGVSPGQTIDRAYGDYQAGQFSLAIQGFNAYLSYFPNLPDAAKAQYYIGEAYRNDNKLEQALAAYDKVTSSYAKSEWVAPARYKRGLVLEMLDRRDAAQAEYEVVVKTYPETAEGRLAKQRLEGLLAPR